MPTRINSSKERLKTVLIDIHLLQNHAPSNLNRDDNGSPKDAVFGGYTRARISSQCLKRSIRRSDVFKEAFAADGLLSNRTRLFPVLLRERLGRLGVPPETVDAISRRAPEFGRESAKGRASDNGEGDAQTDAGAEAVAGGDGQTAQLIFLSDTELDTMAEKLVRLHEEKGPKGFTKMKIDELTRALGSSVPRSVDIAMFGRMTTSAAFEDVQAAVQVAHAISTHRNEEEFDYYTAVDDISGESGAGFIGDTAFNSATYYKYLSVHWEALLDHLGDAEVARRAVQALIEAAALAQPTGKQNSFAAHNLPDLLLVEVRERNLPVSYANAFLKPVRAGQGQSLMEASMDALATYIASVSGVWGIEANRAHISTNRQELPGSRQLDSLRALLEWLPLGSGQLVAADSGATA